MCVMRKSMYEYSGVTGRRFKVIIFLKGPFMKTMELEWSYNSVDGNDLEKKSCAFISQREYRKNLVPLMISDFLKFLNFSG